MSDFNELTAGQKWYVVHTYTGHENKVKSTIERVVENRNLSHLIFDVKVPVVTTTTVDAKGKEKVVEEKIYPGYVFVKMIMNDEVWHIVRYISGVTGFVGPGSRPAPLSEKEVLDINLESVEETKVQLSFNVGDEVSIISGLFEGYEGVVQAITEDLKTVTVLVKRGRRDMPVEIESEALKLKNS